VSIERPAGQDVSSPRDSAGAHAGAWDSEGKAVKVKTGVIGGKRPNSASHGGGIRGDQLGTRSSLYEGRFGRMFRSLPPAQWSREALFNLGRAMTADPETAENDPTLPAAALEDPAERIHDDEENAGIAAGYTYFGQFIDHDITFDPASSLQQQNDPEALVDFRTPRLDLDSVYGRGPADQPYMYVGRKFRLGRPLFELDQPTHVRDLPRYDEQSADQPKRALIGDKRNDENVIVSQFHAAILQFHNKLVDAHPTASFEDVQRLVRWHYQWLVINDFLPTICGNDVVDELLPHRRSTRPVWEKNPRLQFFKWKNEPFMPIEFSAAAYRFGHSMVRPIYRLNTRLNGGDDPLTPTPAEIARGLAGRFFIFAGVHERGLNGFDSFPQRWAIDWSLFFDINGSLKNTGTKRVQPAYKIDTSLVNPLGFLPEFSRIVPGTPPLTVKQLQAEPLDPNLEPANLAVRNLLRGMALGLPSGQAVACAMGLQPIDDDNLRVGKAVVGDWEANKKIAELDDAFEGNAPLWYYVLAEAQYEWHKRASGFGGKGDATPLRLGSVGGRLVAETLIGLVLGDGHSYLRQVPNWQPPAIRTIGGLIDVALR